MSEGRKPDPRRRKAATPHATNFKVPPGAKECGYKAGELYGCYGHRVGAHQPCIYDLTDGELQCPLCAAEVKSVWRGYVPVWDRDFTLRYALIGEAYYESVDAIPHKAQIILTRDKKVISPLVIRAADAVLIRGLPEKRPWSDPVDMFGICRVLWDNAAVNAWHARQVAKSLGATVAEAPLDVEKFSPMMRGAAAHVNRMNTPPTANELFVEAVKRAERQPKPGTNGNHKKKGGGDA